MPKPLYAAVLASALTLTAACGDSAEGNDQNDGADLPRVVTTFSVLADITAEIGGDRVEVRSITPVGAEVHGYSPTPSDVQAAADADLVIENGLGLEEWFHQFIQHADAPIITASEGMKTRPITRLPDSAEKVEADGELPLDPHGWLSPHQAVTYVDNIEAGLIELSPDDAEYFSANADAYRAELDSIAEEAEARAAELEDDVSLVTCEGAFSYLADDLDFEEHYLWPLNAESEGTPQQVEAQIRFVEDNDVDVIFCESTVNDSAQRQVAETTGTELAGPLHVDSLTEADGPAPTHLELLQSTIGEILDAADR